MRYTIFLVIFFLFSNNEFTYSQNPLGTETFYTYEEMKGELENLTNTNPVIVMLKDIGDSRGKEYYLQGFQNYEPYNHDIWAVKVSDNVSIEEDEPSVYFIGLHHGDEILGMEVTMEILKYLVENYSSDPKIKEYVDNYQIWFIPSVNPNAQKISEEIFPLRGNIFDINNNKQVDVMQFYWTLDDNAFNCIVNNNISQSIIDGLVSIKNKKYTSKELMAISIKGIDNFPQEEPESGQLISQIITCSSYFSNDVLDGRDLNRNYEYIFSGSNNPDEWSEPETRAVRDLINSHHFVTGISYHGYLSVVLRPYDYSVKDSPTPPDLVVLNNIGQNIANKLELTLTPELDFYKFHEEYSEPCGGTLTDYGYSKGILNYTIEIEPDFGFSMMTKEERDRKCQANIPGAMYLLDRLSYSMVTGIIMDEITNQPVIADIKVEGIDDFSDPNQVPIHKSDINFGRYYRVLNPGKYNVTFSADGYASQTISNVNITETGITELNVKLARVLHAEFSANTSTVFDNDKVHFINNSWGPITSFHWTFEGGKPSESNEEFPNVEYPVAGNFDVSLSISDGTNTDMELKQNYITVTKSMAYNADIDFIYNVETGEFVGKSSAPNIYAWLWTFSNGTKLGQVVKHQLPVVEIMSTITLTISFTDGSTKSKTQRLFDCGYPFTN